LLTLLGKSVHITTTIGEAYIAILVKLFTQNNGEQPKPEEVADAFRKECSQLAIIKK